MKADCCNSIRFFIYDSKILCINSKCENYLGETTVSGPGSQLFRQLVLCAIFFLLLLYSPRNYCSSTALPMLHFNETPPPSEEQQLTLTLENVKNEIERLGMVCPEVVLAQVKLESGHLTSKLLKRSNNMFGMRFPNRRPTTAIGIYIPALDSVVKISKREELKKYAGYSSYAVYNTWQDAVMDYKLWQEHAFRVNEKYMEFLGKYYAEDTAYVERVKYLARKKQ
jgi:hypothetical protein